MTANSAYEGRSSAWWYEELLVLLWLPGASGAMKELRRGLEVLVATARYIERISCDHVVILGY